MFNKQPFNRGRFNTTNLENSSFFGEVEVSLDLSGKLSVLRAVTGKTEMFMYASGNMVKTKNFEGGAYISLSGSDTPITRNRPFEGLSNINIEANSESFNTYEYECIKLLGLVLLPGDELIINTGEMTVELNGQNVIQYFSRDSDFFSIKPGENIIIYESADENNNADVRILWKDAFL